jgi:hypothetical protein
MPEISIAYTVPVQVLVDTDTGDVTRVVVLDEQVTYNPAGHHEDRDSAVPPNQDDIDGAYEIAQGAAEWPAWDFGR